MIDPRALRTFLAICREGTISGAARRLNISQPSVSVAISQLEHGLKTVLFKRSRTGIELTAEGQALRRRAEAMGSLLRDTEEEIALVREGVRGPLCVGGTPGALVSLLPRAVLRLERQHPEFTVHVLERPDRELVGMLRQGDIEIAFVTTGIEESPEDIAEWSFAEDPFALIVGKATAICWRRSRCLSWGSCNGCCRRRKARSAARSMRCRRRPAEAPRGHPLRSLLTTKAIVRGSTRVTILPQGVVAAERY